MDFPGCAPVKVEVVGLAFNDGTDAVAMEGRHCRWAGARLKAAEDADVAADLDERVVQLTPLPLCLRQRRLKVPHLAPQLPDHQLWVPATGGLLQPTLVTTSHELCHCGDIKLKTRLPVTKCSKHQLGHMSKLYFSVTHAVFMVKSQREWKRVLQR